MSINKYNSEGYPDPTAHGALVNIEQEQRALRAFRPIVYICSPFAGDIEANIAVARRYSRFAVDEGCIPIAPTSASKMKDALIWRFVLCVTASEILKVSK